jgi:hypothetical protein
MTTQTPQYLKLKSAEAQKLGRNGGSITYAILTDTDFQQLYVSIVANDSGGYFSTEIAPFEKIEACLPADRTQPFAAKALIPAFVSRSANQPSFCAALLRAEGLTAAVDGKPHLHQIAGDWAAWKAAMLALPSEPYVPPVKAAAATSTMTRQELPGETEGGEHPGRRKSKKLRVAKPAEEVVHAHPA